MSNFSKIVIIIILLLSFFFIKEKTGGDFGGILSSFKKPEIEIIKNNDNNEIVKAPSEILKQNEQAEKEKAAVYFLALDSNDNGIYKKVYRDVPLDENRLDFAVNELLKGPNLIEKTSGAYSEIPPKTRLIGIQSAESSIIINLSSDFQNGGGTDSIYSRMMQLIKTAVENSDSRKIYLQLDGKQIKFIGGEGIMVTQPLSEKSLEI